MAETLSNLSFVCYILAAIFLVVGITLFILLRIPKTFSDYTGRTARRKIMKIRDANEKTGNKSYRPSQINQDRGKVTDSIPSKPTKNPKSDLPGTGIIAENKAHRYEAEATGLLEESTAELNEPELAQPARTSQIKLKKMNEVMFINTDEVIE